MPRVIYGMHNSGAEPDRSSRNAPSVAPSLHALGGGRGAVDDRHATARATATHRAAGAIRIVIGMIADMRGLTDRPPCSRSRLSGPRKPKALGVLREIVSREQLLDRAREIAGRIAKLPPLTASYNRVALTQQLRRIVDESVGQGLALEGISAADVARANSRDYERPRARVEPSCRCNHSRSWSTYCLDVGPPDSGLPVSI
jgi:enoyl-CoA hydratase/carnithine racemase